MNHQNLWILVTCSLELTGSKLPKVPKHRFTRQTQKYHWAIRQPATGLKCWAAACRPGCGTNAVFEPKVYTPGTYSKHALKNLDITWRKLAKQTQLYISKHSINIDKHRGIIWKDCGKPKQSRISTFAPECGKWIRELVPGCWVIHPLCRAGWKCMPWGLAPSLTHFTPLSILIPQHWCQLNLNKSTNRLGIPTGSRLAVSPGVTVGSIGCHHLGEDMAAPAKVWTY